MSMVGIDDRDEQYRRVTKEALGFDPEQALEQAKKDFFDPKWLIYDALGIKAAGAWADSALLAKARAQGLQPQPFLDINNAYAFFDSLDGLLKTGPTHTNVMDLRVALVSS